MYRFLRRKEESSTARNAKCDWGRKKKLLATEPPAILTINAALSHLSLCFLLSPPSAVTVVLPFFGGALTAIQTRSLSLSGGWYCYDFSTTLAVFSIEWNPLWSSSSSFPLLCFFLPLFLRLRWTTKIGDCWAANTETDFLHFRTFLPHKYSTRHSNHCLLRFQTTASAATLLLK